jgi:anti-anti-sigma factor
MSTSWIDTPPDEFSVDARIDGSVLLISVHGELDLETGPMLAAAVDTDDSGRLAGVEQVRLDLAGLTFIDAAGLRGILAVVGDRTTTVVGATAPALRLFQLTGHDSTFSFA